VHIDVKNGSGVLFCRDVWYRDPPQFDLFTITLFKEATVQDMVSWNADQEHLGIMFSRTSDD